MPAYKLLLLRIDSKACNHISEAASVAHKVLFYFGARGERVVVLKGTLQSAHTPLPPCITPVLQGLHWSVSQLLGQIILKIFLWANFS